MKLLMSKLFMASLLVSASASAACVDISGTYGYPGSDNTMTITQNACSSITFSYSTSLAPKTMTLDGVFRKTDQYQNDAFSMTDGGLVDNVVWSVNESADPNATPDQIRLSAKTTYTLNPDKSLTRTVTNYAQSGKILDTHSVVLPRK